MQVKKQKLELDMEQQTCSKSGKESIRVVYCILYIVTLLTYLLGRERDMGREEIRKKE